LNFAKYLFNFTKKPRFLRSLGCLTGLTLGAYTHFHYSYNGGDILRMEPYQAANEIHGLAKNDYFDKILGNKKDYFFLIIYNDSEENGRKMTKISKTLKKLADENGFESWNTYTINRNLFENIKTIVGKENSQTNIFQDSEKPQPIEIYLKTPHHQDYFYIPFSEKENKFFSERSIKRLVRKMGKMKNLIETVNDEEDLNAKLWYGINKPNTPTVILRIDSNKQSEKNAMSKYAQMVFMFLQRKAVPLDAKFMVVKDSRLGEKLGLEKNSLYVLKNSVIQSFERASGQSIEDYSNCVGIDFQYPFSSKIYLEKYDGNLSLFEDSQEENEGSRPNHFFKEVKSFSDFILPPVMILSDVKHRQFSQFFRKSGQNKSKYTLSLYCTNTDPDRDAKLSAFMNLYKRYKNEVNFCILESDAMQELLPHCKPTQPSFVLFNFFNRQEDYESFKNYYPSINYPFDKYFLTSPFKTSFDFQEMCESLEIILDREGRLDPINKFDENIQELSGTMIDSEIEKLKRTHQDGLIQVYNEDEELESCKLHQIFQKISEDYNKNFRFYRMNSLNRHPFFPGSQGTPQLIYISPQNKKMVILNSASLKNEQEIQNFIQKITNNYPDIHNM